MTGLLAGGCFIGGEGGRDISDPAMGLLGTLGFRGVEGFEGLGSLTFWEFFKDVFIVSECLEGAFFTERISLVEVVLGLVVETLFPCLSKLARISFASSSLIELL